jgi:hypothetical protein
MKRVEDLDKVWIMDKVEDLSRIMDKFKSSHGRVGGSVHVEKVKDMDRLDDLILIFGGQHNSFLFFFHRLVLR